MSTTQITLSVPEQFLVDASAAELGRRLKLYAALLMFQSGELSAGAAAELAETDRFTFAAECARRGIPVVRYAPGELGDEVEAARRETSARRAS